MRFQLSWYTSRSLNYLVCVEFLYVSLYQQIDVNAALQAPPGQTRQKPAIGQIPGQNLPQ